MGVDDGQNAELFTGGELIVDKIHRPDIVRTDRFLVIFPLLRLDPTLRVLVAQLQPQLVVDPADLLHVDDPSFLSQQDIHAAIAIPHTRLRDLPDPPLDSSLVRSPGFVVVGGGVEADGPTGLPDRHAPIDAHPGDDLAQTARLQSFRRMTS